MARPFVTSFASKRCAGCCCCCGLLLFVVVAQLHKCEGELDDSRDHREQCDVFQALASDLDRLMGAIVRPVSWEGVLDAAAVEELFFSLEEVSGWP